MWPECEADGNDTSKTPSETGEKDEMDRFEKVGYVFSYIRSSINRIYIITDANC